jgi:hypothetical protein
MASFACVDSLHYDAAQKQYIGKSASTGQTRVFATLPDYQRFLENLEKSGHVCPDVSIPQVHVPRPACGLTKEDPSTGFLEFKPKNPALQSLYDAMSPFWKGTMATNEAVKQGLFKADAVYMYKASDLTSTPRQQASDRGVPREGGSSR